jgi:hypothetical protein
MKKYQKAEVVAKNNPKVQYAAGCNIRDHATVEACDRCRTRY